jgi:hypothetical protein
MGVDRKLVLKIIPAEAVGAETAVVTAEAAERTDDGNVKLF